MVESPGLATLGLSPGNTLAATISDNTAFSVMGSYSFGKPKVFGGYEHISYANPNTPLVAPATAATATAGFPTTIGGYVLGYTNNAAFANNKILEVYWAGVKYTFNPKSEATLAYYRYNQSAFGTGALAGCNTASSGTCSGRLAAYSFVYDYRLTKRFDTYFGAMWSSVYDGLSSGYLQRATIDPTIGVRYTF